MEVIPVIDLQGREVVRGIAGRRAEYCALCSGLSPDASPARVARGIVTAFGFSRTYVADLDAIAGAEPAWDVYSDIADAGLRLLIDAGISGPDRARAFRAGATSAGIAERVEGWIVGLESVEAAESLRVVASLLGERSIFSLDLREGRPLVRAAAWSQPEPMEIAAHAARAGFARLIVLDLADVGRVGGTRTLGLCRELRRAMPDIELIAGGGVRGAEDLDQLEEAGCNGVLVASALHDGRLTRTMLWRRGAIGGARVAEEAP